MPAGFAKDFADVSTGFSFDQSGTIHHVAHIAIQIDVIKVEFGGFNLERIFFIKIAVLLNIRMSEKCVIIEIHLGIERDHSFLSRNHQRIDFSQRTIIVDKKPVKIL